MKLVSLLDRDLILLDSDVNSLEEAVVLMTRHFTHTRKVKLPEAKLSKAIMDRNELGGTVFPNGLAIPHARVEGFDDLVIGICRPRTPFPCQEMTVRFVVIMLTSQNVSTIYLQTLASLVKMSREEELFEAVCRAETPVRLMELLEGIRVKKELLVEDIMSPGAETISPEATLGELADTFYKKDISYLPVVDSRGEFIGEVTPADLLRVGIPGYARMMENLHFLTTLEPFDDLLRHEDDWHVEKIMQVPKILLEPSYSVIEAALEMTQHQRRHLPVVKDGRLVGILHIKDFLTKVIRG